MPELAEAMKQIYGNDNLMMVVIDIIRDCVVGAEFAIKQNIEIVKSLATRRNIYNALRNSLDALEDTTQSATAILDNARQSLRDIVVTGHTWHSMSDVLTATFDALEKRGQGEEPSMPSGVKTLDKLTTGFHKGELTVIGARPAVGKSAFAAHIALMAAQNGYKVGVVSREMTDIQYGIRILARGTGIDNDVLRTGKLADKDWDSVVNAMQRYSEVNISFLFTTRYIEDLRLEVQNKVDSGELDILIVDYMQLMQTKRNFDADYLRIAHISKALKDMTTDLNIAVVALAQVGRSAQEEMPKMSELRGSGDIEQDADNIIFLHRPTDVNDKYVRPDDRELFMRLSNSEQQYIVLNVAKQRQGVTGSVAVTFDPSRMRYSSIIRDEVDVR